MDSRAFDRLSKDVAQRHTRRTALGDALAGGLLGALGVVKTAPEASAAQGGVCTLAFAANVRLGPSLSQPLSAQGQPGELRGSLSFGLDQSGRLVNGVLQAASGERFPVVGQATGYSLQARIELASRMALVVAGVGEQEVADCRGAIDGVVSGPQAGDLGDWHAASTGASGGGKDGQGGGQRAGGGGQSSSGGGQNPSGGGRGPQGSGGQNANGAAGGGRNPSGGGGGTNRSGAVASGEGGGTNRGGAAASGGNAGGTKSGGGRGPAPTAQDVANCQPGEDFCEAEGGGGFCAYLTTNISNCGACGHRCDGNREICQDGVCVSKESVAGTTCAPGEVFCFQENGYCADLTTNPANCGLCGYLCAPSEICRNRECISRDGEVEIACPPGETLCDDGEGGTECYDLEDSPLHCGGCGTRCPSLQCQEGRCLSEEEADNAGQGQVCSDGLLLCDAECVDPMNDPGNCGTCNTFCPSLVCEDGRCPSDEEAARVRVVDLQCGEGLLQCADECIDPMTSAVNCGACGNVCVPERELCVDGGCTTELTVDCGIGQSQCGRICCAAGETCVIGECVPNESAGGCKQGLTGCGGVCIDLNTDPANCGGCGVVCAAGEMCQFQTCTATTTLAPAQMTCADQGLTDCFGACSNLQYDASNCNVCGNVCLSGQCVGGACTEVVGQDAAGGCPSGQEDCGGGCIDVVSDPANCGACGNVCAADQQRLSAQCTGGDAPSS